MQLSVPQRGVADSDSFPVEPEDVERWLAGLRPLALESDAREVHRGLKHSNRLHNDPARRRAVLERFVPVLRELHEQLVELTRAQPLPLAREFSRGAALVEALLREEAFAFKILLADSEVPAPEDARRAMHALARQAEVAAHGYRRPPGSLLGDAHGLYALAESRALFDAPAGTPSLADDYRYILLLALVDTRQIRVRQLPLALDFLRESATSIELRRAAPGGTGGTGGTGSASGTGDRGVHLAHGTAPEPLASLLVDDVSALRVFDVAAPVACVNRRIARTRTRRGSALGTDILERQTLGRLRSALLRDRGRRAARTIAARAQSAVFGHREIATHLLFDPAADGDGERSAAGEASLWTLADRSAQGVRLHRSSCRAGAVQVGELVALDPPDESAAAPDEERRGKPEDESAGARARAARATARTSTLLGTVRWVHADGDSGVTLGIEYLARGVLPVVVARADAGSPVSENALIIACKVQRSTVQTILLPPYLYEVGERLVATRGSRSRTLGLQARLQGNGLFDHFLID